MSASLLIRAWRVLREEGVRSAWFRSLAVLGYRRFYLLRRPLSEPLSAFEPSLPVTIGWLAPDEAVAYREFREAACPDDTARRLRRGDRCLVARHDGRIVGTMWGSTTWARSEYLGRDLPMADGEAFQFDAYTAPEVRGRGIAPALAVAWLVCLRDEGRSAAVLLTLPENTAALRAHAKAGYRVTGIVRSVRLGPWRHHFPLRAVKTSAATASTAAAHRSTSRGNS